MLLDPTLASMKALWSELVTTGPHESNQSASSSPSSVHPQPAGVAEVHFPLVPEPSVKKVYVDRSMGEAVSEQTAAGFLRN